AEAAGPFRTRGAGLVRAVDRSEERRVDADLAERLQHLLGGGEPVSQRPRAVGQVFFELGEVGEPALDLLECGLPLLVGGEDAGRIPGVLDRDVLAGGDRLLAHLAKVWVSGAD